MFFSWTFHILRNPSGSCRWTSPGGTSASSSKAAHCLLENQHGGVFIKTKLWLYTWLERPPLMWMTCGGKRRVGLDPPVGWNEEKEFAVGFVDLWKAGCQSQGNKQTDGWFCSCMAPSSLSSPWATASSLKWLCSGLTSVWLRFSFLPPIFCLYRQTWYRAYVNLDEAGSEATHGLSLTAVC